MTQPRRLTPVLLLLTLACAFSFGAIVRLAFADDYHVTCVGHGFLQGSNQNDGSFFARVESGCGSATRSCDLYVSGSYIGGLSSAGGSCNAWSRDFGDYTECHGYARLKFNGQFSEHTHIASNWCG